jgi:hypothetical protein
MSRPANLKLLEHIFDDRCHAMQPCQGKGDNSGRSTITKRKPRGRGNAIQLSRQTHTTTSSVHVHIRLVLSPPCPVPIPIPPTSARAIPPSTTTAASHRLSPTKSSLSKSFLTRQPKGIMTSAEIQGKMEEIAVPLKCRQAVCCPK